MTGLSDAEQIRASAGRLYETGQRIWHFGDRWNTRKRAAIDAFARKQMGRKIEHAEVILDLGCGSEPYDWLPKHTVSFDRFYQQVEHAASPVIGDLECLPFKTASADLVICVASVLNYVSAAEALAEIGRVTKLGGCILLHFETSTSFEHVGSKRWRGSAVCIKTINAGRDDIIWVYNPSYIISILANSGFRITRRHRFHIASAFGLRIGLGQQKAAPLAALDDFLSPLAFFADDFILIAERIL